MPSVDWVIASALFGGLIVTVQVYVFKRRDELMRHANRFAKARELLARHSAALDLLLSDAAVPDGVKSALLEFSEAVASEATARDFARMVNQPPASTPAESTSFFQDELAALKRHRPDLGVAFETALMSGFVYMIYRWPDTILMLEDFLEKFIIEPNKVATMADRVVEHTTHSTIDPKRNWQPAMA